MPLMPLEKINKIAEKFNMYCSVAEGRYEEPKYVFAALLTILEVLEENEYKERMKCLEEKLSSME